MIEGKKNQSKHGPAANGHDQQRRKFEAPAARSSIRPPAPHPPHSKNSIRQTLCEPVVDLGTILGCGPQLLWAYQSPAIGIAPALTLNGAGRIVRRTP